MKTSNGSLGFPPFRPRFPWWGGDLQTVASRLLPPAVDLGPHAAERLRFILPDGTGEVSIHCHTQTHAKTGVEMEALTGATIAALTLYDMAKAVSHGIVIREIRLLEKTGGKADYRSE